MGTTRRWNFYYRFGNFVELELGSLYQKLFWMSIRVHAGPKMAHHIGPGFTCIVPEQKYSIGDERMADCCRLLCK